MSMAESPVAEDSPVKDLVAKARIAQEAYESFTQEQVDAIVRDIGKFVFDNAEPLAIPQLVRKSLIHHQLLPHMFRDQLRY